VRFAAGAGILSFQMLAYSLLGIPWGLVWILLPWAAAAAGALRRGWRPRWTRPEPLTWIEWAALAAALAAPILWLPYERVMPLSNRGWDAWAIWLFKAKAFAADGQVQSFLARAGEFNAQPSYPLLVPLLAAFLLRLTGSDQAAKAISPLFFFALLAAFYGLARRFASRPVALVFTAMLANLHMVNIAAFELAGYADTTLSVYLLLGAGYLYGWYRDGRTQDAWAAAGFAGLAAWTKNEGLFFFAAVALLLLVRRPRAWAPAGAAAALTVLPWIAIRHIYELPGADLWTGSVNWANLWPGIRSFAQAFDLGRYNLTFWLLAASLAAYRKLAQVRRGDRAATAPSGRGSVTAFVSTSAPNRAATKGSGCAASDELALGLDRAWLLLPGLVLWQLAGLLGVYLGGRNDLTWWIGTSLDRILAQVAPLALLAAAVAAERLKAPEAAPAQATPPARKPVRGKRR